LGVGCFRTFFGVFEEFLSVVAAAGGAGADFEVLKGHFEFLEKVYNSLILV
jgi:hypothetical protein